MGHHQWEDIPAEIRREVEHKLGSPVVETVQPSAGRNSDVSLSVVTEDGGRVFVKGVLQNTPRARMHLNEVTVHDQLPDNAPRLLWTVETREWLVLGYEHVDGRHADFSPGSADLPLVARLLTDTTEYKPANPQALNKVADKWARVSPWRALSAGHDLAEWDDSRKADFVRWEDVAIDTMTSGTSVVHSDVHELNVLVSDGRARFIDWAWAARGPAWIDPAFAVVRLVGAGHSPMDAEAWATQIPAWKAASDTALTGFSVAVLGMWRLRNRFPELTDAARRYARYRLEGW